MSFLYVDAYIVSCGGYYGASRPRDPSGYTAMTFRLHLPVNLNLKIITFCIIITCGEVERFRGCDFFLKISLSSVCHSSLSLGVKSLREHIFKVDGGHFGGQRGVSGYGY